MTPRDALADLKERIIQEARGRPVWSYPTSHGCAGWDGTGPIFCSLIPASRGGHGPQYEVRGSVRFLYEHLFRHGFGNAHLTDAVKFRATNADAPTLLRDSEVLTRNRAWLLEEVEIIQPSLIVAMGKQTFDLLQQWLPHDDRLRRIPHYSWAYRWKGKAAAQLAGAMAALAEVAR